MNPGLFKQSMYARHLAIGIAEAVCDSSFLSAFSRRFLAMQDEREKDDALRVFFPQDIADTLYSEWCQRGLFIYLPILTIPERPKCLPGYLSQFDNIDQSPPGLCRHFTTDLGSWAAGASFLARGMAGNFYAEDRAKSGAKALRWLLLTAVVEVFLPNTSGEAVLPTRLLRCQSLNVLVAHYKT
ncbi:hypothetical protein ACEPAI_9007 [Sanghuangporus weigelae]